MNKWLKSVLSDFCIVLNAQPRVFSKRVYVVVESLKIIQLFSILIPPEQNRSPPWNYSDLKFLWQILASFGRLNYLVEMLKIPDALVFIVISAYSLQFCLEIWIFIKICISNRSEIYLRFTDNSIKPILLKLESMFRFIFTEVLFIPTIFILLNLIEILQKYGLGLSVDIVILIILSTIYFTIIIIDSLFLQDLSWKADSYTLISIPKYIMHKRICCILMCAVSKLLDYSTQAFMYAGFNIIVGIYLFHKFFWIQPYAYLAFNLLESFKGIAFFLSGVIFFILELQDESSHTSYSCTLIFFLSLPLLTYICKVYIKKRRSFILKKMHMVNKIEYMFLMIYSTNTQNQLPSLQKERTNKILESLMTKFSKNPWGYLWGIHHFLSKKQWIGAHILLSESTMIVDHGECFVYLRQARYHLLKILKDENGQEWEGFNFVNFRENLNLVLNEDKICCNVWLKVYQKLLAARRTPSIISNDLRVVLKILKSTKELCIYLIKNYESNSEILDYYSGFLENLMNSPLFKDVRIRAIRKKDEETHLSLNKDDNVSFFNQKNMKLSISLENRNSGIIKWVYNSELLGYTPEQLENEHIANIIPSPIKEQKIEFIQNCKNLWNSTLHLESTVSVYLQHRNGFLIPVYMASRIVSSHKNNLIMINSIMVNKNGNEIALLNDDGKSVNYMTSGMAELLCSYFNVPNEEVLLIDLLSILKVEKWKEGLEIGVVYHNVLGEILLKTSELTIYGRITLKVILALKKTRDRKYRNIEYNDIISIKLPVIDTFLCQPRIKFTESESTHLTSISRSKTLLFEKDQSFSNPDNLTKDVTEDASFIQSGYITKKSFDFRSLESSSKIESQYKHLKKIVKINRHSINRNMRFIKLSMILCFIVQTIIGFLLYYYLRDTSIQNIQDTSKLSLYNYMRYIAREATYKGKLIYAYDNGMPLDIDRQATAQEILTLGSSMHNYTLDILNGDFAEVIEIALRNKKYIWWSYRDGSFIDMYMNNIDIPKRYATLMYDLGHAPYVNNTTESFMEMFRNVEGESLANFNKTAEFLAYEYYLLSQTFTDKIIQIFNSIICIVYLFEIILIGCILISFNRIRRFIWTLIFSVSKTSIQLSIMHLKERLLDLHREDVELESSSDMKLLPKSSHSQHKYQIALYIMMAILIAFMLLLIFYPTFIIAPKILYYLKRESELLNWNGESLCLFMKTFFLLQEKVLFPNILKTNIYTYSIDDELIKYIQHLKHSETIFFQAAKLSDQIEKAYYEKIDDDLLSMGFKAAVNEYIMMIRDLHQISYVDSSIVLYYLPHLYQIMTKISGISYSFHATFLNDLEDLVEVTLTDMLHFIVGALVSIGVLSFTIIFPLLGAWSRVLVEESEVILCIPREDSL